jgi:hypothetical protein
MKLLIAVLGSCCLLVGDPPGCTGPPLDENGSIISETEGRR